MRHLSVERSNVALIQRCKSNGWYATGHRVQRVGDETAIPLNDDAPGETDSVWEGLPILERDIGKESEILLGTHLIRNAYPVQR